MAIFKDSAGKATQHVYGVISPDGRVLSGEGFSTRRIWSGTYIIEFDQPFAGEPAVISTIYGNEWQTFDKSIAIVELGSQYFVPVTSSMDRPEDCAFTFIASGNI